MYKLNIFLDENQIENIIKSLNNKITLIEGAAGTGKTLILIFIAINLVNI
jgi:DNA replication protein DnaC